jgi:hypothetical protein
MPSLEQVIFYGPFVLGGFLAVLSLVTRQRNLGMTFSSWALLGSAIVIPLLWILLMFALAAGGL